MTTLCCRIALAMLLLMPPPGAHGQAAPEHLSNAPLYDLLDELANQHLIELNTAVKPLPRAYIAERLLEALAQAHRLSPRQRAEVQRYLHDFALEIHGHTPSALRLAARDTTFLWSLLPPTLTHRDSLFRFNLKPILGANHISNANGAILHSWGGAGVTAYVGRSWAVWASLRDNRQAGGRLTGPTILTQELGGNYKALTGGGEGGEFSEMRGGIAWSWGWGHLSLQKDHLAWGDAYHGSNILSGRTPSYAMIKLHMAPTRWLDFTYHHGWLMSEVVDSARTYIPEPGVHAMTIFRDKYIAANILTFTPIPRLAVSLGNSIIYSDIDVHPGYLNPFMFYKSVAHTQAARSSHNHNSQLFVNVSSRLIRHLHLYGSWFVDEFSVTRVFDPARTNFTSTKGGIRLSGWPIRALTLTAEYTFTYPKTYQHRVPATTFASNRYGLGHYLKDNARELHLALRLKPIRGLTLDASYTEAEKGNVQPYSYLSPTPVDQAPFMQDVVWRNRTLALAARYTLYNNFSIWGQLAWMNIQGFEVDGHTAQHYLDLFTPRLFHGHTNTLTLGMQVGF